MNRRNSIKVGALYLSVLVAASLPIVEAEAVQKAAARAKATAKTRRGKLVVSAFGRHGGSFPTG